MLFLSIFFVQYPFDKKLGEPQSQSGDKVCGYHSGVDSDCGLPGFWAM
jgi:hypothetical protein